MAFVRYNGMVAAIVKSGRDLVAEHQGSDLDDHLGLWFGEVNEAGQPVVYIIPAEYVQQAEAISPDYRH